MSDDVIKKLQQRVNYYVDSLLEDGYMVKAMRGRIDNVLVIVMKHLRNGRRLKIHVENRSIRLVTPAGRVLKSEVI